LSSFLENEAAGSDSSDLPKGSSEKMTEDRQPSLSENARHYYQLIRYLQNEGVEGIFLIFFAGFKNISLLTSEYLFTDLISNFSWFYSTYYVNDGGKNIHRRKYRTRT
jgi:hypothetical protein